MYDSVNEAALTRRNSFREFGNDSKSGMGSAGTRSSKSGLKIHLYLFRKLSVIRRHGEVM